MKAVRKFMTMEESIKKAESDSNVMKTYHEEFKVYNPPRNLQNDHKLDVSITQDIVPTKEIKSERKKTKTTENPINVINGNTEKIKRKRCMFSCFECKFSTSNENRMIKHLEEHYTKREFPFTCTTGFQCYHCNFRTLAESVMKNHLLYKSSSKKHFVFSVNFKYPQSYICDFCGIKVDTLQRLELHRQNVHQPGSKCSPCNQLFPDFETLLSHSKYHK